MIEIFSGTATLCSVAKQFGMSNSLALDKIKKRGSKTTIFVFDITKSDNRELLPPLVGKSLGELGAHGARLWHMQSCS